MKQILTVHGINSRGEWQHDVMYVLEPHFACTAIQYKSYRRLGATKLIFEPWILFPSMVLILVGLYAGYLTKALYWFLGALVLSHLGAYVRRWGTRRNYEKQAIDDRVFELPPHMIAHSLGTYLTGETLNVRPEFHLDRIILVGCVLSKKWKWRRLLERKPGAFTKVRNEVQRKDWVAVIAETLRAVIPGFGMAGFSGFRVISEFIHTNDKPNAPCPECNPPWKEAPIHNMVCPDFFHSGALRCGYAAYFWLPFFWGIEPWEYSLFLSMCLSAANAEREYDWAEVKKIEAKLANFIWSWAGCRLTAFVSSQIQSHPRRDKRPLQDLVDLAIRGTWRAFDNARLAYHKRTEEGWKDRVLALNPRIAATKAVHELFR